MNGVRVYRKCTRAVHKMDIGVNQSTPRYIVAEEIKRDQMRVGAGASKI